MSRRKRPARIRVPEEFDGPYTGILIGTYGAYLPFAEQLFRRLPKTTVNRIVLADRTQLTQHLETVVDLRKLNRTYVAAGVASPHAHHPKYVMLLGPESGVLLVGSGNLSVSGYTGPGECFGSYRWSPEDERHLDAFTAVRHLVDNLCSREWIDPVAASRLADFFSAAPWLPQVNQVNGPVRHNLERSFLDQLDDVIDGRPVVEVVAGAPFHDRGARALRELLARLGPSKLILLVQPHQTRLDKQAVVRLLDKQSVACEVVEVRAPKPYPPTGLHAKLVLVRTGSGDVLLQGSPNLSEVALVLHGDEANVEIANLLEGRSGAFDSLLDAIDCTPLKGGIKAFEPAAWDDDNANEEQAPPLLDTLTWVPPRLEGRLKTEAPPSALSVVVAGRVLVPSHAHVEPSPDGEGIVFQLEFTEEDAARIDRAAGIRLQMSAEQLSEVIYPYHLHSLVRLSSSGHRVDLLQEAGVLDLTDRELEDLLAELDRVLIVDGLSLWRLAHPSEKRESEEEEGTASHIRYEDLDWEQIGEQPVFIQYQKAAQRALLAPTELGIVLHALTDRFRAEVRHNLGIDPDDVDDVDGTEDLGVEQTPEDEEALDLEDEEPTTRRLSARSRVRRLWRNFVKRFVGGLADDDFVRSVGSHVIIPSYVVFNHLCRRLRVVDLIDADYLTEAQIQLWGFMWGTEATVGYIARLPSEERAVALQILADHEDLPAMLAAVDDAWWHVEETEADLRPLRDTLRAFLANEQWIPLPGVLSAAAAVATNADGDPAFLLEDLGALADATEWFERDRELAECLGIERDAIEEVTGRVKRAGAERWEDFLRINDPTFVLRPAVAADAIAIWADYEPDRTYFRLAALGRIAIVDRDADSSLFFDVDAGTETPLEVHEREAPSWRRRLDELAAA